MQARRDLRSSGLLVTAHRQGDWFTVFGNVFDVAPPISTVGNPHYDVMGTYFVLGVRAQF